MLDPEKDVGKILQLEQELMTFDDIKMLLDGHLQIKPHPIPSGMVGNLLTIDGITPAAYAIFKTLERRAKMFNGHTKPQREEK